MADMKDEKTGVIQETNGNGEYLTNGAGEGESYLALDRKLVRKIDWHLLPWICLLYALGLLDRYVPSHELHRIIGSISVLRGSVAWTKSWF